MRTGIEKEGRVVMFTALIILSVFVLDATAQQGGPMMGQHMMGQRMMQAPRMMPPRVGLMRMLHRWEIYLFAERENLGLKEDQIDKIESILITHRKYVIPKNAERRMLQLQIQELLVKDKIDPGEVEQKVKALAAIAVDKIMEAVRTFESVLAVLTPEQRKKAEAFFKESIFIRP